MLFYSLLFIEIVNTEQATCLSSKVFYDCGIGGEVKSFYHYKSCKFASFSKYFNFFYFFTPGLFFYVCKIDHASWNGHLKNSGNEQSKILQNYRIMILQ